MFHILYDPKLSKEICFMQMVVTTRNSYVIIQIKLIHDINCQLYLMHMYLLLEPHGQRKRSRLINDYYNVNLKFLIIK
jgi:hypothetical protein